MRSVQPVNPLSAVPLFLAGLPVVAYTRLAGHEPAWGLAICHDTEGGYYLFGCDGDWNTITDTWHPAMDDALHQAEYEHPGVSGTWERPSGGPA